MMVSSEHEAGTLHPQFSLLDGNQVINSNDLALGVQDLFAYPLARFFIVLAPADVSEGGGFIIVMNWQVIWRSFSLWWFVQSGIRCGGAGHTVLLAS